MILFETQRLKIRIPISEDLENIRSLQSDLDIMRSSSKVLNIKDTKAHQTRNINSQKNEDSGLWTIIRKKDHQFIGQCGLITQIVEDQKYVEVGYILNPQFWNQGYASESVLGTIKYGKNILGIQEIIALIDPSNQSSKIVAKKVGLNLKKKVKIWGKTIEMWR